MEIKVLGSGCASCKKLLATTEKAVKEIGVEADVILCDRHGGNHCNRYYEHAWIDD